VLPPIAFSGFASDGAPIFESDGAPMRASKAIARTMKCTLIVDRRVGFGIRFVYEKSLARRMVGRKRPSYEVDLRDAGEVRAWHMQGRSGPFILAIVFVVRHWEEFQFWVINVGLP
jgi:hypothetical protein